MHHEICWHAWIEDKEIFSWKIKINTIVFITQHLLYYFLSASLKVLECYLVPFVKSHQEHYLKPLLFYFQNYVSILGHCGHFLTIVVPLFVASLRIAFTIVAAANNRSLWSKAAAPFTAILFYHSLAFNKHSSKSLRVKTLISYLQIKVYEFMLL